MLSRDSNGLLDSLFRSHAACTIFSEKRQLQSMLDFEAALARVQSRLGVIGQHIGEAIAVCCRADRFDREVLAEGAARSGNLAIPMVSMLTAAVQKSSPEASGYVHWGATSQDAIDTGFVLQLRDVFQLVDAEISSCCGLLASLAKTYRHTPMAGRTWLQQGVPITFGLKAAGWLDSLLRHQERLRELTPRVLVLQFGGAAGTLASLGSRGLEVAAALAAELGLAMPAISWHANRDRLAEAAAFAGVLMGTLGKIARDLALMGQTEVAEIEEPAPGGSSTMPHKRNPVGAAAVLSSSLRVPGLVATMLSAMGQEHERGLGGWHAEWETLPTIYSLTLGAIESLSRSLAGLKVFPDVMRQNLDKTQGLLMAEALTMALADRIGRAEAHARMQKASHRAVELGCHLRTVVERDEQLMVLLRQDLTDLFNPSLYLGVADSMIENILNLYEAARSRER